MSALRHPADVRLLARLPAEVREQHGVPTGELAADRAAAVAEVTAKLADELLSLHVSPLGEGWTAEIHARLARAPDEQRLLRVGWIPLRNLPRSIGGSDSSWLVVASKRVLGRVDLHVGAEPEAAAEILLRCERRGEVRACEVLELRSLRRAGAVLPRDHPAVVAAARLEGALGGDELADLARGRRAHALDPIRLRRPWRRARRVVAVSGVDGSGKSTLVRHLVRDLDRAGVAHSVVWARPGMGLERLAGLLRWVKRRGAAPSRHDPSTAAPQVPPAPPPEVRHSPFRRAWSWVVAGVFLAKVRGRHVRAYGVVVYDRHVPDALASLAYFYGSTHRRAQLWLVRAGMPRARHRFHLDVDADLALARDPAFPLGREAIQAQLTQYERWLDRSGFARLDGTSPPDELSLTVLRELTASG